jgi:hypothetical protein
MKQILDNIFEITLVFEVVAVIVAVINFRYMRQSKLTIWAVFIFINSVVYEILYHYFTTIFDEIIVSNIGSNVITFLELYCLLYLFTSLKPIVLPTRIFYLILVLGTLLLLFESFSVQNFLVSRQFSISNAIIAKMLITPIAIFYSLKVLIEMYRKDDYYPQIPYFWVSVSLFLYYVFSLIVSFPNAIDGSNTIKLIFFVIYCFVTIVSYILIAYAFWLTRSWIKRGGSTLKY